MKAIIATTAALGLAAFASPAIADDHTSGAQTTGEGFTVVEKNSRGKVTKVSKDGKTYDVCMTKDQDACINPRAAGLKWGNRPLGYWPGRPASQM